MRIQFLAIVVLFFASCTEPVVEKPEDLLSEDAMVDIYFDIALFNASKNSGYDQFAAHHIDRWDYIANKYDVDSTRLASSGLYYAAKPLVYERIYTRVEERLDSLKQVFDDQIGNKQEGDGQKQDAGSGNAENPADSLQNQSPK